MSSNNNYDYDFIVIGLGGVGSFALRALARELKGTGKRVLGIERYHRCNTKGSSHGESRIFRRAYFEDEGYIPWIDYSIKEWELLQQEQDQEATSSNPPLLNKCGNLILQDAVTDSSDTTTPNYLQLALDTAKKHNIDVEFLDQDELKKRYPQFCYHQDGPELMGLLEPDAGFVRPELAMSAALSQAEALVKDGCVTIWEQSEVLSFKQKQQQQEQQLLELQVCSKNNDDDQDQEKEEADVTTTTITVTGKKVLIAAGPWTSQLIPSWSKYLTVTRQCQGWVDVSQSANPQLYMPNNFPTWILATKNYHLPFFGIPVTTTSDRTSPKMYIKVGVHNHVDKIDDPSTNSSTVSQTELEEYQRAVRVAIDGTAWNDTTTKLSDCLQMQPCMYTMTPDDNFLMGVPKEFHQQQDANVYAIAGLSGHGFKMVPALGQILADFALVGEEKLNAKWHPDRFCNPNRFDVSNG